MPSWNLGGPELDQRLLPWLGKEVRDPKLANELRMRQGGFVIGELCLEENKADRVSGRSYSGYRMRARR